MRYFSRLVIFMMMYFVVCEVLAATPFTFKQALDTAYRNNPELQAEMDKARPCGVTLFKVAFIPIRN